MTIDLKTDSVERIEAFCNSLKYFKLGCSWGGFESLAFPAITTMDSLNYHKPDLIINRIRLYVGLDHPQTLIADLDGALQKI
jgi:cystathionine beta-lyase/cystathionine gamma-synthase